MKKIISASPHTGECPLIILDQKQIIKRRPLKSFNFGQDSNEVESCCSIIRNCVRNFNLQGKINFSEGKQKGSHYKRVVQSCSDDISHQGLLSKLHAHGKILQKKKSFLNLLVLNYTILVGIIFLTKTVSRRNYGIQPSRRYINQVRGGLNKEFKGFAETKIRKQW